MKRLSVNKGKPGRKIEPGFLFLLKKSNLRSLILGSDLSNILTDFEYVL